MIRVLRCNTCGTLEELADFDGPPEYDTALEYLLSKHEFPSGERHIGRLIKVEERAWKLDNLRNAIIEQIKGGSPGIAAFDPSYYHVRDTFKEDALKCYSLHLRPKEGCPDYKSDRKMLVPDTKAERKDLGLPKPGLGASPVQWLCQHCPVDAYYKHKASGG